MNPIDRRTLIRPTLSLFASTSTLLCCALPALLITVGAGAVMAGLTATFPGIMWLSANKGHCLSRRVFCWLCQPSCNGSPEMHLALLIQSKRRHARLRALSRRLLGVSVGVYATVCSFAYLWPLIYL